MKSIILTFLVCFLFFVSNAQQPLVKRQNDFLQKFKEKQITRIKTPLNSLVLLNNSYAFNQYNMKFLFENNKGKVYESYIDHMHILAPTFNSTMPVLKSDLNLLHGIKPAPMPNPMPKTEIIPMPDK